MGVVYKAQDTKLKRIVALKFLPANVLISEEEKSRFLHEAQAAAALDHPNICTVYEIDEENGQTFIAMAYLEGKTVKEKLSSAPLSVEEAIDLTMQVAQGLQAAHEKGIIHRDIKSSNILVTEKGQAKIMDFGLARRGEATQLTKTGVTLGTVPYMSPEQSRGEKVDNRTDIWSLGIVLYEMLTGGLAFKGEYNEAIIYAILHENPKPVTALRSGIPMEVERIIDKCLEKDRGDRYQRADELIVDLRRMQKRSSETVQLGEVRSTIYSKKKLWVGIVTAILLVGVASVFITLNLHPSKTESASERKMLAVLPFENLESPDQEYFADGMTEEITSRLSGLSGLGVIARSSAMQYKKTTKSIKQIGDELAVSYILQGTIRSETVDGARHVRINPQLIKVADGTQVWSQPYEAILSGVFKLQSDISSQVASALDVALLQPERKALESKPTNNPEAYDAYLRGNEYLARGYEEKDIRIAEQMFQRAVELDPNFAVGYAQISIVHARLYWYHFDHTEESVIKARETAEKALQLNPELPDAHVAMGWYYYWCRLDYDNALKEFEIAQKSQPNNAALFMGIGSVMRRQGKMEDAITNLLKAVDLDPRSSGGLYELGQTYVLVRKYPEAERSYDHALSLSPDFALPYYEKARLYLLWEGNAVKSRAILEEAVQKANGEYYPEVRYLFVMIDVSEKKYQDALRRLTSTPLKVIQDQFRFIPRELLYAQLYGLMHQPQQERAYYDSARIIVEDLVRNQPEDSRFHSALGIAYAGLGRKQDAIREGKAAVDALPIAKEAWRGAYRVIDLARIYTMVGEHDAAIDQIEQLLSIPSEISIPWLRIDPIWTSLRDNPRFKKLLEGRK